MKKFLIIYCLLSSSVFGQVFKFGEAKGMFMALSVGPRFPLGDFASKNNIGAGVDVTFSYTDNEFLPLFFYTRIGYQHIPGKKSYYRSSDYSELTTNMLVINPGIRYFFPPFVKDIVILMPVIEAGGSFAYIDESHEFKIGTNKTDFIKEEYVGGFHVGAGVSMFLLDVMGYYHFFRNKQYLVFELRIRIPIFVKI